MSVFTQGNILQAFIVNTAKLGANPSIPAVGADLSTTLLDSQVVAVGRPVGGSYEQVIQANSSAGTYDYFRMVQLVKDPAGVSTLNYGPKIDLKNLVNVSAGTKTNVAAQEQIYVMGYNGTSGSLDVTAGNEFIFTIAYDHDDILWSEQKLRNSYDYYSQSPTQKGLAQSMTAQINYKEQLGLINGTGAMVSAVMLADGTGTSLTNSRTVAVVNGSNYITLSGALTTNFAVGDLIRLGSGALATTDPVYVISALGDAAGANTTTVFQIHTPYQGTSGTIANANAGTVGTCTNYGFKLTGQALTFTRDFFKYNKVKFHLDLKGFGTSTLTKTQESKKGIGVWQEASEYESFSMGNEGALNRMKIPIPAVRGYASSSYSYDVTSIASMDYSFTSASSSITGNSPMRVQQFIFFPNSSYGTVNKTMLGNQLNNLLGVVL